MPRTAAWLISRICPLNLVCYYSRPMMVLVPSPPLLPPSKIHPGSLPTAVRPFPLSLFSFFPFTSSPSVSVSRLSPSAASGHPSSVRRTPPADSSGGLSTNALSWFPASRMKVFPPTCAAGGTWLGCGWRRRRRWCPPRCSWVPWRVDRRRPACVFFWSPDQEGMPELWVGVPGPNLGQWPILIIYILVKIFLLEL